jgi:hypothetical protein
VTFRESSEPFACILIFPPPLECSLATGQTMFALDIGGGFEVQATPRTFLRVDAGDLLLKYSWPTTDSADRPRQGSFFSSNFRFAAGAGWRF